MMVCLLEALLGVIVEVLVRIILWPLWLVLLMILATPYALIAALYDQTALLACGPGAAPNDAQLLGRLPWAV